jgi:hypothetical protein
MKPETVLHDVDDQLCQLVEKLQRRVRAPIEGDAVRMGRVRAILSLHDVATFLNAIGAGQDVANHFEGLATVLHDLNEGSLAPPLLVPAPSMGNRPEVSLLWEVRGIVALSVDILIRSGMTEGEAVAIAASHHGLTRLLTKREANLRKSIEGWYKKAKQAAAGGARVNPFMLHAFKLSHKWNGVPSDAACEQSGRHILKYAVERAKAMPSIRLPIRKA